MRLQSATRRHLRRQSTIAGSARPTSPRLRLDRKSTRLNSSHSQISYAVFCLKKKTPLIDYQTGAPFPGQIIPTQRLYAPGAAVLNRYPLPNVTQAAGTNYNYQVSPLNYSQLA